MLSRNTNEPRRRRRRLSTPRLRDKWQATMWRPGPCTARRINWMTTCLVGPVLRHRQIARQGPAKRHHRRKRQPLLRNHLVLLPLLRAPWFQNSVCPKENPDRILPLDPLHPAPPQRTMLIPPRSTSRAASPCMAPRLSSAIWIRRSAPSRSRRTLHTPRTQPPASPPVGATALRHNTRSSLPRRTA